MLIFDPNTFRLTRMVRIPARKPQKQRLWQQQAGLARVVPGYQAYGLKS